MKRILFLIMILAINVAAIAEGHYKVTASSLFVRNAPNAQATQLGKLKKNQVVTIDEITDDGKWGHVQLEMIKEGGWVSMKYMKPYETSADKKAAKLQKVKDSNFNQIILWVSRSAAIACLILLLVLIKPAKARYTLRHMLLVMIFSVVVLGVCSFTWINWVRWFLPVALCAVIMYPLYYLNMGKVVMWILNVLSIIVIIWLVFGIFEGQYHWFWKLCIVALDIFIANMLYARCVGQICPMCKYYANHGLIHSELTGDDISTEHDTHDTYSHSETYGNTRTNYYTRHHTITYFLNRHYKDYYQCERCGGTFSKMRTVSTKIGKENY